MGMDPNFQPRDIQGSGTQSVWPGHHLAQALPDERMREALRAEKLPFEAGVEANCLTFPGAFAYKKKSAC